MGMWRYGRERILKPSHMFLSAQSNHLHRHCQLSAFWIYNNYIQEHNIKIRAYPLPPRLDQNQLTFRCFTYVGRTHRSTSHNPHGWGNRIRSHLNGPLHSPLGFDLRPTHPHNHPRLTNPNLTTQPVKPLDHCEITSLKIYDPPTPLHTTQFHFVHIHTQPSPKIPHRLSDTTPPLLRLFQPSNKQNILYSGCQHAWIDKHNQTYVYITSIKWICKCDKNEIEM